MDAADEKPAPKKRGKKKGTPKTGGRKKGTPNRNSLSVLGALDKANIPVIELLIADIAMLEPAQRIEQYHRLLAFCYPKLKDIDYVPPLSGSHASPPPAGPASKDERLALIRGHLNPKSQASG